MCQSGVFNASMRDILARSRECNMSHGVDRNLSDFGKSTMALAQRLEEDPHLGLIEQVFIENHIHMSSRRTAAASHESQRRMNLSHEAGFEEPVRP